MNRQEIDQLRADSFAEDWKLIAFLVRDGMRKRGIRTIPITGYTAEEKERRAAIGHIQNIRHGG